MLASTAHWQPLDQRLQRSHSAGLSRQRARSWRSFRAANHSAILEPLGARYAVFHLDLMAPNDRDNLIRRLDFEYANYLRPLEKDGNVWLYEIVGWPR